MKNKKGKSIILFISLILLVLVIIMNLFNKTYIVGKDIKKEDINEFYYTYYNINYNAKYQRYRLYKENDKYYLFHDKREKPNDYGPLTEKDITRSGTIELNEEEWNKFFELIKDGKVIKRQEDTSSGDDGPWMYIYWKNDKDKYQEYTYASYDKQIEFVDYAESLIEK